MHTESNLHPTQMCLIEFQMKESINLFIRVLVLWTELLKKKTKT